MIYDFVILLLKILKKNLQLTLGFESNLRR